MKTNNLAFLFVITDIYHEYQEITISNAFLTFLIQVSHEKLQELYSRAPSNKKFSVKKWQWILLVHPRVDKEWMKGVLFLVLQQGQINCGKDQILIIYRKL